VTAVNAQGGALKAPGAAERPVVTPRVWTGSGARKARRDRWTRPLGAPPGVSAGYGVGETGSAILPTGDPCLLSLPIV